MSRPVYGDRCEEADRVNTYRLHSLWQSVRGIHGRNSEASMSLTFVQPLSNIASSSSRCRISKTCAAPLSPFTQE